MDSLLNETVKRLGGQTAVARRLGVTQGAVHHWIYGIRRIPARRAMEIEHMAAGAVRADDLCPAFEFIRDAAGEAIGYRVRTTLPLGESRAA